MRFASHASILLVGQAWVWSPELPAALKGAVVWPFMREGEDALSGFLLSLSCASAMVLSTSSLIWPSCGSPPAFKRIKQRPDTSPSA